MTDAITGWMNGYLKAWESNDPEDIRAIFTEDATYRTQPYGAPWRGHQEIIDGWTEAGDTPGNHRFEWHVLAIAGDLAFVQGETIYPDSSDYSNLWVIRLAADGRASDFTEWWVEHPPAVGRS
jgi:ketosteroid isomerase-like protein